MLARKRGKSSTIVTIGRVLIWLMGRLGRLGMVWMELGRRL